MVNTRDCGSRNSGSSPDGHPTPRRSTTPWAMWSYGECPPEAPEQDCEGAKGGRTKKPLTTSGVFSLFPEARQRFIEVELTQLPKYGR